MKAAIVAMDRSNAIGYDNDLPWGRSLKDDLANFRNVTAGQTIIMGRKTFESIGSRPLPNRQNIVVSRSTKDENTNVEWASDPDNAYQMATSDEIYVIGGAGLWQSTLEDLDRLYVTYVDADFPEATVFFPQISCEEWQEIDRQHFEADERNAYSFDIVTYDRIIDQNRRD